MKKYIAFLLCLIMILSLISCNFNDDKDDLSSNENGGVSDVNDGNTNDDNITPSVSENEKAMQMYEAAINDKICVFDEHLGEIKLKACRFPSNDTRLDECNLLMKAVLDVDQDGINEYVIKSTDRESIILHYYDDKVYSYCLDGCDYYKFNTDGTFYWCISSETLARECGLNEIIFEGETLNVKSVYNLKVSENPIKYEYYVDGEAVTENEWDSYRCGIYKETMKFSYFELTQSYPVTAQQAWNLANAYWDNQDGGADYSAGTKYIASIVLIDMPNPDTTYYRLAFQTENYSGGGLQGYECMSANSIKENDQILVNAFTGEITTPACEAGNKCISVEEAIEIVENHCKDADLDNGKNVYRGELDGSEPAPDHIYVIVIQKIVDNYYAYDMEYWIDKYTGEIVTPYYMYGKG